MIETSHQDRKSMFNIKRAFKLQKTSLQGAMDSSTDTLSFVDDEEFIHHIEPQRSDSARCNTFDNESQRKMMRRNSLPTFSTKGLAVIKMKSIHNRNNKLNCENKQKIKSTSHTPQDYGSCSDDKYRSYIDLFKDDENFYIHADG